jgi:hypothetical protein
MSWAWGDRTTRMSAVDSSRRELLGPVVGRPHHHEGAAMSQKLRSRLEACLGSLLGIPFSRCLVLNSFRLDFGAESDPQGERYLWIEPPWRLMAGGRFVVGSRDCPWHEDYEDKQEHSQAYAEWSAPFMGWGMVSISGFRLGNPVPDLSLTFSSGHTLETFNSSEEEYSWYYREVASRRVMEAFGSGITRRLHRGP